MFESGAPVQMQMQMQLGLCTSYAEHAPALQGALHGCLGHQAAFPEAICQV